MIENPEKAGSSFQGSGSYDRREGKMAERKLWVRNGTKRRTPNAAEMKLIWDFIAEYGVKAKKAEIETLLPRLAEVSGNFQRTVGSVRLIMKRTNEGFYGEIPPAESKTAPSQGASGEMSSLLADINSQVQAAIEKQREADQKKIRCLEEKLAARDKEIISLKKQRRVLKEVLLVTCRIRQEAVAMTKMMENIKKEEGIDVYALVSEKD